MGKVERIGVSLEKQLLAEFDRDIEEQGYNNRSEAIRDMIRLRLSDRRLSQRETPAAAAVFLVYDHHSTKLTRQLAGLQHGHLLRVISSMHVHLDEKHCLETVILKGKAGQIRQLAERLTSLKGVKLGKISVIAID